MLPLVVRPVALHDPHLRIGAPRCHVATLLACSYQLQPYKLVPIPRLGSEDKSIQFFGGWTCAANDVIELHLVLHQPSSSTAATYRPREQR